LALAVGGANVRRTLLEKVDLKERFGDNPKAIALYLTKSLAKDELKPVLKALNQILIGQNVMAVARKTGIRRTALYRSFGGEINPTSAGASWRIECQACRSRLQADTRASSTEDWLPEKTDVTGRLRLAGSEQIKLTLPRTKSPGRCRGF
jgi:DNA-binding phage protein